MDQDREMSTLSQHEQWRVQSQVFQIFNFFSELPRGAQSLMLELQRDQHLEYLTNGLRQLGPSFVVLDASRPWLCYWILHSISLLGDSVNYDVEQGVIEFLNRCQDSDGGYGGGPGQIPHLATTYAAVSSLISLGGEKAYSSINRSKLYDFLRRMKDVGGGFRMHENGEIDVRACYTAISVASILNIMDDELIKDVDKYVVSCQSYEGGIAGEPGCEAHGGYTFCGLATMLLIGKANQLNLKALIEWAVFRQGEECGFQGRINKLVDGCYSFWQGGALHLAREQSLFQPIALQQYILLCSQVPDGGFRDKPGKPRDFYHTCYCLSGLSLCQHDPTRAQDSPPPPNAILGPYTNLLEPLHPLHNVTLKHYHAAIQYFNSA